MSRKYLDSELVEVELRDWFIYEYKSDMPVLEIIHKIENILRNMESENTKIMVPKQIYYKGITYTISDKCPKCGTNIIKPIEK